MFAIKNVLKSQKYELISIKLRQEYFSDVQFVGHYQIISQVLYYEVIHFVGQLESQGVVSKCSHFVLYEIVY